MTSDTWHVTCDSRHSTCTMHPQSTPWPSVIFFLNIPMTLFLSVPPQRCFGFWKLDGAKIAGQNRSLKKKKSCIWVTLGPLVLVWLGSTATIPWVWVSTMGVVNTMHPCLYHDYMCIPWVRVYTNNPCRYDEYMSIPQVLEIHKYKLLEDRNTNYNYRLIQVTEIQKYNWQKYKWQKYINRN